ncbi:unnamed protein product [Chrysoparadoxa australica]
MLIYMLFHVDPIKGPTGNTKVALSKLPLQSDGRVEFWEFELYHKAFPGLFYPAFRLQVKMMQVLWGEKWWLTKKRGLQDKLEQKRALVAADAEAEDKRREKMRQRKIKKALGCISYYLFPWRVDAMEAKFPRDGKLEVKVEDPAEIAKKEAESKAELARILAMRTLNTETEEYRR